MDYSKTLTNYFLPLLQHYWDFIESNLLIAVKLNYNTTDKGCFFTKLYSQPNSNQSAYFITITAAIDIDIDPQTAYFFYKALSAPRTIRLRS